MIITDNAVYVIFFWFNLTIQHLVIISDPQLITVWSVSAYVVKLISGSRCRIFKSYSTDLLFFSSLITLFSPCVSNESSLCRVNVYASGLKKALNFRSGFRFLNFITKIVALYAADSEIKKKIKKKPFLSKCMMTPVRKLLKRDLLLLYCKKKGLSIIRIHWMGYYRIGWWKTVTTYLFGNLWAIP